jgi:hypothetical protein
MGAIISILFFGGDDEKNNITNNITGNNKVSGNTITKGNTITNGNTITKGNTITNGNTIASSSSSSSSNPVTTTLNPSITKVVTVNTIEYRNKNNTKVNEHGIPLTFGDFLKDVIEASHVYILLWFIIVYLVVYIVLGYLLKNKGIESIELIMSRIFDFMIFVPLITYLLYRYYIASDDTKDHILIRYWDWSINWLDDIMNLFGVLLFAICFYLMLFFLKVPMSKETQPFAIKLLEDKIWAFIATFIILMFFKHLLNIDILVICDKYVKEWTNTQSESTSKLQTYLTPTPTPTPTPTNTSSPVENIIHPKVQPKHDEVFNIGNNLYTYEDAQQICSVYGARLANYDEIEDAYNHGGEWCNYGWSEGQMVFFPTQKSTWDKLQKNPNQKNSCGRPGINGGYIENPYIRFGVNCYGKRPDAKKSDIEKMNQPVIVAKTQDEIEMDKKMKFWKDNADKLLQINSFNQSKWSEF